VQIQFHDSCSHWLPRTKYGTENPWSPLQHLRPRCAGCRLWGSRVADKKEAHCARGAATPVPPQAYGMQLGSGLVMVARWRPWCQ
jgi:hypothetical protein